MRGMLLVLLALASGCEVLRPPTELELEDRVQLFSLLEAGADTVAVLVEVSGTRTGKLETRPVSGATVRIEGGGTELLLREAPTGFSACTVRESRTPDTVAPGSAAAGCYAAVLPGGVRSGTTYALTVELPGGGTITGRSTVPHPPTVLGPGEGTRIALVPAPYGPGGTTVPFVLRWRTYGTGERVAPLVEPGPSYRGGQTAPVTCHPWLVGPDGGIRDPGRLDVMAGDSATVRGHVNACFDAKGAYQEVRIDSMRAILHLVALDSAYARHVRQSDQEGVREHAASIGITGAYGVFTSSASARRSLTFVYDRR